jgi:hypothetical protein
MPEGYYYGVLTVRYRNGDSPEAVSERVHLDVTPPTLVVRTQYSTFSPTATAGRIPCDTAGLLLRGDLGGRDPRQGGKVVVQRTYEERILPSTGTAATLPGTSCPTDLPVPGRYDRLCRNLTVKELTNIVVDTRPTPVSIVPADRAFLRTGTGDSIRSGSSCVRRFRTESRHGLSRYWTPRAKPVRTYRGGEDRDRGCGLGWQRRSRGDP